MSQTLIWHLIRDNNSFLVKRGRTSRDGAVQFSSEAGNLMNAHSFKYSGLANNRAVDVSSNNDIRVKDPKSENKPSKTFNAAETIAVHGSKKAQAKVVALVSATRPDLLAAAKIRVAKTQKGVQAKLANRPKKVAKSAKRGTK